MDDLQNARIGGRILEHLLEGLCLVARPARGFPARCRTLCQRHSEGQDQGQRGQNAGARKPAGNSQPDSMLFH
jgi:hypothetical protein